MSTNLTSNDQLLQKNILAMAMIIGQKNKLDFRKRLDSYRVHVVFQNSVKDNANFRVACVTSLNLLPRFLRCVSYSGTLDILNAFPPSHASKISLGSDGCDHTLTLVFGRDSVPAKNTLYVGADGWSCYLSRENPCSWQAIERNSLSSMFAASLAIGEIFKDLLHEVPSKKIKTLEYDLITHGVAQQPVLRPQIPEITHIDDLTLVGCGAIGQAFCDALRSASRLSGRIELIDNDILEKSNEQRYLGAFEENRGQLKVVVLANLLKMYNPALVSIPVPLKYEDYTYNSCIFNRKEVISAVDSVWTRLNIQAGLPKTLWNGWTDVDTGTLRYGIGKHSILGEHECLWCSYYPSGTSPSQMDLNVWLTGFDRQTIEQKLQQNAICTFQDIQLVSSKSGIPIDLLRPNVGRPFQDLLHGNCGVFVLKQPGHDVVAPAPHVSALCGILLATQVILKRLNLPSNSITVTSSADFDAFGIPSKYCITNKQKNLKCFCRDPIYQDAYREKWKCV